MIKYSNRIELVGRISGAIAESHRIEDQLYYCCNVVVRRLSGTEDFLPAIIPDSAIKDMGANDLYGGPLRMIGEIRVYTKYGDDGKRHQDVKMYVHRIEKAPGAKDDNKVTLTGIISRKPVFRVTPFGREICDFMLLIRRGYGKQSYIPCIAWGCEARKVKKWTVDNQVNLTGRFQSRVYTKVLDDGTKQDRMAYEVSISHITKEKEKK